MMMLNLLKSIGWAVLICAAIHWLVLEKILRPRRRLPPGPTPLPVIGNLHHLTNKPHKALAELAKIHGPLMLLRLGFLNTVVVTSPEAARQVLQKKDVVFAHRFVPDCFRALQFSDYSTALMPVANRWRTVRKISTTLLFSKQSLDANQGIRMQKIKELVSYISNRSLEGVAVNIGQLTFDTSLNLLSNTFFSMDLADPNSELSCELKRLVSGILQDGGKPNLADLFPILRRIDPQGLRRLMGARLEKLFKLFDTIIDKRLASRKDGTAEGDDMLDALLKICWAKTEDFEHHQIRRILLDLFIGGTETTSSTLEWAMAELVHNPTKLKATQEELRRVIGSGNFVKEADLAQLPYLEAVVNETLRLHPAVPLLVPRKADTETEVNGFEIPKGCQVFVNVWAIARDPSLWKDPNKFEPERFLNSKTDFYGNHFEFIPFGSGRRICVGMELAVRMVPLMLANLLSFFEWKLEDGMQPEAMDMDDKFGLALSKATAFYAIPVRVTT